MFDFHCSDQGYNTGQAMKFHNDYHYTKVQHLWHVYTNVHTNMYTNVYIKSMQGKFGRLKLS